MMGGKQQCWRIPEYRRRRVLGSFGGNAGEGAQRWPTHEDPLGYFVKPLVLLAGVVLLREVDEVDDGLGREELERVEELDLCGAPVSEPVV